MAVVGTAYVIVKAITKNIGDDIAKQIKGSDIGEKVGASISESVEKSHVGKKVTEKISKDIDTDTNRNKLGSAFHRLWTKVSTRDKSGQSAGGRFMRNVLKGIDKFRIPPVFWLSVLALPALGGAMKILGAYVGAATSLIAALGPAMAGAALGAASLYSVLGQVVGVLQLILKLKTDTLKRFQEAIKNTAKQWVTLGESIQKRALPEIAGAFQRISDELIPAIGSSLQDTGSRIGRFAKQVANLTAQPLFQSRLRGLIEGNNRAFSILGQGLIQGLSGIIGLLRAANPLLIQFAEFFRRSATRFNEFITAAEKDGSLKRFVATASSSLSQLGRIFKDTFGGLVGIFRAAYGPGTVLLNRIEDLASRFNEWANSFSGQSKLRTFFANALPIVHEFNGLIGDLAKMVGNSIIGNPDGTITFIQTMRNQLLPVLGEVASSISKNLGPSLLTLAEAFGKLIQSMSDSGALGAFTKTLAALFNGLSALLNTPIIGQIVGFALAFLGVAKAVSIFLKPLGGLAKILPIIFRVFVFVIRFVNPWVLAITTIVTVIVLLYQHSETFRKIVQTAWAAVLSAGKALWAGLQAGFKAVVSAVQTAYQYIVPIIQTIWSAIVTAFTAIINAVRPVAEFIGVVLVKYVQILAKVWEIAFKSVLVVVKVVVGLVILQFQLLWKILEPIIRTIARVIRSVFNTAKQIVVDNVGAIVRFVGPKWDAVYDKIATAVRKVRDIVERVFRAIRDFMGRIFDKIAGVAETGWGVLKDGASGVVNVIKGVLNGIIDAINLAVSGLNKVINAANKLPGPDIGTITPIPRLANGAYVKHRPGGVIANIGEGIHDEVVLPLTERRKRQMSQGGGLNIHEGAIVVHAEGAAPGVGKEIAGEIADVLNDLVRRARTA